MSIDLTSQNEDILAKLPPQLKDMLLTIVGSDESGVDLNDFLSNSVGMGQIVQKALFQGNFPNILTAIQNFIFSFLNSIGVPTVDSVIDLLARNDLIPNEIKEYIKTFVKKFSVLSPVILAAMMIEFSLSSVKSFIAMCDEFVTRDFHRQFRTKEMDAGPLVRSVYVNPSTYDKVKDMLAGQGYPDSDIDLLFKSARAPLPLSVIQFLYMTGQMQPSEAKNRLHENGFTNTRIEQLILSWYHVLTFGEVLQQTVRGAFDSELDSALGLSDGETNDFIERSLKAGYSPEDARSSYRAHWTLPDPRTALLMRERGMISDELYKKILTYSGIAPSQIENMTMVNYALIPFRILATAYHEGAMDDTQLMKEIVSHGFGDERAKIIFTYVKESSSGTKTAATEARIIQAYGMHAMTRDDAKTSLISLHYTDNDAEWLLDDEDAKNEIAIRKERENTVKESFEGRLIEQAEARSELAALDYAPSYIDALLDRWNVRRNLTISLPSKTDLDHFLSVGAINEDQYVSYMQKLRYSPEVIKMYLDFKSTKKATSAQLAEEKLQQTLEIKTMENGFKDGIIDESTVRTNLIKAGVDGTLIQTFIVEWTPDRNKALAAIAGSTATNTGG